MNRLKSFIKLIFGENEDYSVENRLYISALIIGIAFGFIGTFTNYILLDSLSTILIPFIETLILCVFYYFVRIKGYFKQLAFPIIIFAFTGLGLVWYSNGGIDGSNDIIFIVTFILAIIMVQGKKRIYVLIIFVFVKSVLYFIQLYRPDLILPFPSEKARWMDLYSTSLYTSLIIYLIINFLHRNYTRERNKVEDSKKELLVMNQKLKELNDIKDILFSIISHDLRSPFNSIIGFSKLLVQNSAKYDTEHVKKIAGNINITANETYLMLDNLLKWSRIQKEMDKTEFIRCNLQSTVDESNTMYKNSALIKNITIKNLIDPEIFIFCDEEMTKTISRNLLVNAIKFTQLGGSISISAIKNEKMVEIIFADSGIGISEDRLPELFDIKKNKSTRGTSSEKGTGLGLHLCKILVEKQGGKIRVESKLDKGSKFIFTLPQYLD